MPRNIRGCVLVWYHHIFLPPPFAPHLNIQALDKVPVVFQRPASLRSLNCIQMWFHNNSCNAREQILQDPRKSWSGEFDGWFRVDFEQTRLESRILARHHKVDTKKFESVREGLKCKSLQWRWIICNRRGLITWK